MKYFNKTLFKSIQRRFFIGLDKIQPFSPLPKKDVSDEITYLTMCCKSSMDYLSSSLWSVAKTWQTIPKLVIVSDGTVSKETIAKKINWWQGPIEIHTWEYYENYFREKGQTHLADYAKNELWGKKLAAVLGAGETGPTLYADTDVLWFQGPPDLPHKIADQKYNIRMCLDEQPCYDEELLAKLSLHEMKRIEPFNAGVVYINGPILQTEIAQNALKLIAQNPDNRSEQTFLAIMTHKFGDHWEKNKIFLDIEDAYLPLFPNYYPSFNTWVARHYVNPVKHLFWRDLFLLKRKLRKKH